MGVDNSTTDEYESIDIIGLATQLGINVAIAVAIISVFIILRPNNSLVYAPKYKYSTNKKKPPQIPSGLFSWLRVIVNTPDDILLEKIGYDAVLFISFIRMLRRLMFIMACFGVFLLIPLNVIANRFTSTWPPEGIDVLSLSAINSIEEEANSNWYWIHCFGTWLFSFLIYFHLLKYYRQYIHFRQLYFKSPEYQRSPHARTLIIFNVPPSLQSDEKLKGWIDSMNLKFPVDQVSIGRRNDKLAKYVEEYEADVRKLEIALSKCLQKDGVTVGKRPKLRKGGFLCFGGQKVDAIDYYTERVQSLREKILDMRSNILENKATNYGWISFKEVQWAHSTAKHLSSSVSPLLLLPQRLANGAQPRVELAPQPKDIIWNNLSLNEHIRRTKRITFTFIFYVFVLFWFIPSGFLSASSTVKDIISIFPNSKQFLKEHKTFVGLLSSWFTPIVMAIFFIILPIILRIISKQQGNLTTTSLDRQVFAKLYTFFIINNLFVFTVASIFAQMYTQIKSAAEGNQVLTIQTFFSIISSNLGQIAKKINNVSAYWLSYVTLKCLGVTMDLAQIFVLVVYTLRKIFTRPSPRQLQEFARPSHFDYPVFYNLAIFFFTLGLMYSVISPLILPFTLVYFVMATVVFKYLLMYVVVTRVETGGQMWRILFNRLIVSILLFQIIMIGVLKLKSANIAAFLCIPLPILTGLFKFYCLRRLDHLAYFYKSTFNTNQNNNDHHNNSNFNFISTQQYLPKVRNNNDSKPSNQYDDIEINKKDNLEYRFGDPAFFSELPVPMVHDNVRHLLPALYGTQSQTKEKTYTSKVTRKRTVRQVSMIQLKGCALPFQGVKEDELENDDSAEGMEGFYKFDDEEELDDKYPINPTTDTQNINNNSNISENIPLTTLQQTQTSPKRKSLLGSLLRGSSLTGIHPAVIGNNNRNNNNNDPYSATRPLINDSSSIMVDHQYDDSYLSNYILSDQYHSNTSVINNIYNNTNINTNYQYQQHQTNNYNYNNYSNINNNDTLNNTIYNNNYHHQNNNNYNYNNNSEFINNNNNNNNNIYNNSSSNFNNTQTHPDVIEMSPFLPSQVGSHNNGNDSRK